MRSCVWCNGIPKLWEDEEGHFITCEKCGFKLAGFSTEKQCLDEWEELLENTDSREFCSEAKSILAEIKARKLARLGK